MLLFDAIGPNTQLNLIPLQTAILLPTASQERVACLSSQGHAKPGRRGGSACASWTTIYSCEQTYPRESMTCT